MGDFPHFDRFWRHFLTRILTQVKAQYINELALEGVIVHSISLTYHPIIGSGETKKYPVLIRRMWACLLVAFLIPDDAELDHMNGTVEIAAARSKVVQADEADEMHFALQAQAESSTIG